MVANWAADGAARKALAADANAGLIPILTGMGSLSYGELAGERMKLGLLLHDPEEEHDCFSDNTYNSHYNDQLGIRNVYTGHYTPHRRLRRLRPVDLGAHCGRPIRRSTSEIRGQARRDGRRDGRRCSARAESVEAYDQMIGEGNAEGNAVVQAAIDGLIDQTRSIERAVAALGLGAITVEGSDSLDNPDAVFQ